MRFGFETKYLTDEKDWYLPEVWSCGLQKQEGIVVTRSPELSIKGLKFLDTWENETEGS